MSVQDSRSFFIDNKNNITVAMITGHFKMNIFWYSWYKMGRRFDFGVKITFIKPM